VGEGVGQNAEGGTGGDACGRGSAEGGTVGDCGGVGVVGVREGGKCSGGWEGCRGRWVLGGSAERGGCEWWKEGLQLREGEVVLGV